MAFTALVHMTLATASHSAKCDVMAGSLILSGKSAVHQLPWEETCYSLTVEGQQILGTSEN